MEEALEKDFFNEWFRYPARAHIGDDLGIYLCGGDAVATLDIVGFDGELRAGIEGGFIGEEPSFVMLGSYCFLRFRGDKDGTVEEGGAFILDDAFVVLTTGRVWALVMNGGMEGEVLFMGSAIESLEVCFGLLAL